MPIQQEYKGGKRVAVDVARELGIGKYFPLVNEGEIQAALRSLKKREVVVKGWNGSGPFEGQIITMLAKGEGKIDARIQAGDRLGDVEFETLELVAKPKKATFLV
jgi:hypothetical protein